MQLNGDGAVPLLAAGGLATLMIRHLMAWRFEVGRSHLPWVLISASGILFALCGVCLRSVSNPDDALVFERLRYTAGLCLPGLALASLDILAERPISRAAIALLAAPLVVAVAMFGGDALIVTPSSLRHGIFGNPYYAAHVTPLMSGLIGAVIAVSGVAAVRRVRAIPPVLRSTRFALRMAVLMFVGLAVHDLLASAGAFTSTPLLDLGYIGFGMIASRFELRRTFALRAHLDDLVQNKERELAEKQRSLDESRATYQTLADATREGVVICRDGRIMGANAAMVAMLGPPASAESLRGGPVADLFVPADRPAVEALDSISDPIEVRARRGDGGEIAVSVKLGGADDGQRVLLLRDLSEEKRLHRQLVRADRLASIGTLAAGTAHEINNPLAFVLGNVDLLGDELDVLDDNLPLGATAGARALAADVKSGAERIRGIVRQLMSLAREEEDHGEVLDVRAVLEKAVAMAASQVRPHARVVLDCHDGLGVVGSEGRLVQVVLNLVVNAGQAIVRGNAADNEVRVSGRRAGDRVEIEVSDTGSGMDGETRERIFDPFFTTKGVGEGTGLGLPISLGLVTAMGGTIIVESAPGRGSTFRVLLPAATAPPPPAPPAPAPAPAPRPAASGALRVLVVDDEPLVGRTVKRMLSGYDVEVVTSVADALAALASGTFAAIVCDLMLPEMTGMDLFAQLSVADPSYAGRFLFMTGGTFTPAATAFLKEPGRIWIAKPFERAELLAAVARITSPGGLKEREQ